MKLRIPLHNGQGSVNFLRIRKKRGNLSIGLKYVYHRQIKYSYRIKSSSLNVKFFASRAPLVRSPSALTYTFGLWLVLELTLDRIPHLSPKNRMNFSRREMKAFNQMWDVPWSYQVSMTWLSVIGVTRINLMTLGCFSNLVMWRSTTSLAKHSSNNSNGSIALHRSQKHSINLIPKSHHQWAWRPIFLMYMK